MIRSEITKALHVATRNAFGEIDIPKFVVEIPENPEHGDYAANIAFALARIVKKSPNEVAAVLAGALEGDLTATAVGGFINIRLSEKMLTDEFQRILKEKTKYATGAKKNETIQIEFISANPTGQITLGNGRGGFLGDALGNVLKHAGYSVWKEYYVNDAEMSNQIKELGKTALGSGETYLTPELKKIIDKNKATILRLVKKYEKLGAKNIEGKIGGFVAGLVHKENEATIAKVLKIKFDKYFHEEWIYEEGLVKEIIQLLQAAGLTYEKDGAMWFKSSTLGDSEDRVLLRSNQNGVAGEPTYLVPDLAYHFNKFKIRKFDKVIDIWGADHHGYAPRLAAALAALGIERERLSIIITQLVRLVKDGQEVRMSKRKGQFITLEEVVSEVGLDAARFFFLMYSPDSHMDFDLGLAKERSAKNPVYYVQYAHARISSILKKTKIKPKASAQTPLNPEERMLIKKLIQFSEVVEDAAADYQVSRLPRYAMDLARVFHNFYEKHRVISEDRATTAARLALVCGTQIILKNVLTLMGIDAPTKM